MGLNAKAIGLKIQQARVSKGLTQGDLAKALGIDRGSVGRWETGRSIPRQVGLPRLAKALGVSPEFLTEGAGDFNAASETIEVLRSERRTLKAIREEVKKLAKTDSAKEIIEHNSAAKPYVTTKARPKFKAKIDKKALEDLMMAWDQASPEARIIAALVVTEEWSYKLKLMNRETTLDEEILSIIGRITA